MNGAVCLGRWHRTNFAIQARALELYSQNDVLEVLEGFLYSNCMNWHGFCSAYEKLTLRPEEKLPYEDGSWNGRCSGSYRIESAVIS
jgi:hypothetical protein